MAIGTDRYASRADTLLVIEADDIDAVMRFVGNDPYVKEGLFSRVEVRPWAWSLGNPERRA